MSCCCVDHKRAINTVYDNIVCDLQQAELIAVPHVPVNSLKPFWNKNLDSLKEKSVFWGRLWIDAGGTRSGELFKTKNACSLRYKCAITQALYEYEHEFDEALFDHFIH
jgi:hypothetical protein